MAVPTTDAVAGVIGVFLDLYRNKGMQPPPLDVATVLDSTMGLESLDFAEAVVRLEERFGTDPFALGMPQIRTIGDLAKLYVTAG